MESTSDIADCKRLLDELENIDQVKDDGKFLRLSWVFEHLPAQVAPRLQRDFDQCVTRAHGILANLFNKIDISNKTLLNSLLRLFIAYGHLRMSLVTYHIESHQDETIVDPKNSPIVAKTKWYDLTPLLPAIPEEASLNWKQLLLHALVIDEPQLFQTSFRLLIQKLHFHSILLSLGRYSNCVDVIKQSGANVAEKIGEKICDFAHDDYELISIDSFLFNLLIPFTSVDQQAAIIEAIILARFKTQILEEPELKTSKGVMNLNDLISNLVMNKCDLQEILSVKIIQQLKCNIIRRKRRHSVEAGEENVDKTVEARLVAITDNADATELLSTVADIEIDHKKLQKTYLKEWINFVQSILLRNELTPRSSSMLLQVCSILLVSTSNAVDESLKHDIAILLATIVDAVSQRWAMSFFKICNIEYLIELTKALAAKTDLLDYFDTPLRLFYSSYLAKYMKISIIMRHQQNPEKISKFVTFVCDNTLGKGKSHIIQYMLIKELARLVDDANLKGINKFTNHYLEHNSSMSKKLYKFIKRHLLAKPSGSESDHEVSPIKQRNENENSNDDHIQAAVIDALVCILKISIDKKEQDVLDVYGELMLRLYHLTCSRVEILIGNLRKGLQCDWIPLDSHLPRLVSMYAESRETVEPYLCYELNEKISSLLVHSKDTGDAEQLNSNLLKKDCYNEIKIKLDAIQAKGSNSEVIYHTLINRQYGNVVEQTMAQAVGIRREPICCENYSRHMKVILDLSQTLFNSCDQSMYEVTLDKVVKELEECDALDHAKVLYLLLIIEALISANSKKEHPRSSFKNAIPRISCCLIRISKFVELGPSVHSFTNAGGHKSVGAIQCCTYSVCIRIFTLIFRKFPAKESDQFITDAMQVCVSSNLFRYAKYSTRLHYLFIQLASSIAGLLKSVCIGRKHVDTLKTSMPVFLSVFSTLVRCIILASDRQKLNELPKLQMNGHNGDAAMEIDESDDDDKSSLDEDSKLLPSQVRKVYELNLEHLAHDVGRLMNNLSFLETKLVDYAPHVISSYIKDTQRASCPDFVKKHLDEGVYRIFNLIDAFQKERHEEVLDAGLQRKTSAAHAGGSLFDMIHSRLDQASREIFRSMHENYNRFHRYQGKC